MCFHLLICAFTLLLVSQKPLTTCHAERSAAREQQFVEKKSKQDRLNNFQWIKGKEKKMVVLVKKKAKKSRKQLPPGEKKKHIFSAHCLWPGNRSVVEGGGWISHHDLRMCSETPQTSSRPWLWLLFTLLLERYVIATFVKKVFLIQMCRQLHNLRDCFMK